MSKALVIGSTVCDVMVYLDRLPSREGDAHIHEQTWSLGGCAFNVVSVLHALGQNVDFISPVGTGVYGDFVKAELERLGIQTPQQLGQMVVVIALSSRMVRGPFYQIME